MIIKRLLERCAESKYIYTDLQEWKFKKKVR